MVVIIYFVIILSITKSVAKIRILFVNHKLMMNILRNSLASYPTHEKKAQGQPCGLPLHNVYYL